MRKRLVPVFAAIAFLCPFLRGEDAVTMRMEHRRLMQFEPVIVFVSIRNLTDDVLLFEEGKDGEPALTFRVDRGPTDLIRQKRKGSQLSGKLRIMPGDVREAMVELSRWHDLTAMGGYVVTATAEYEGQSLVSKPVRFDVENGLPLVQAVRLPFAGGVAARNCSLRYMSREGYERLFLCVGEEQTGVSFGAFDLGPLIRVKQPEIKGDKGGVITVVHESGSGRYTRSVFRSFPEGVAFVNQTYHHEDGTPYEYKDKSAQETSR